MHAFGDNALHSRREHTKVAARTVNFSIVIRGLAWGGHGEKLLHPARNREAGKSGEKRGLPPGLPLASRKSCSTAASVKGRWHNAIAIAARTMVAATRKRTPAPTLRPTLLTRLELNKPRESSVSHEEF